MRCEKGIEVRGKALGDECGDKLNVEKTKLKAKCQDEVSVVYHYLQGVSPSIASLLRLFALITWQSVISLISC